MAMGQSCLFLTGLSEIHTMEIGSSDSTLFFDDFDSLTNVTALYQDKKRLYIKSIIRSSSSSFISFSGKKNVVVAP